MVTRKNLDLINSRVDRWIYRFRGAWWTVLSLLLAFTLQAYIMISLLKIEVNESMGVGILIIGLLLFGLIVQLPENILFLFRGNKGV